MDESSRERNWLDDRLQAIEGGEGDFTVVNSPLRPVVERADPWKADVRHHELKAFLEPLEPRDDGRARVAVMTDVEEDPVARVQTAVLLARRLAEQGRRVLLVDADVRHVGLSRWLSDRDLDAEGLVDVLQYGASVSALRRPGPVDGVDVLAVGSYRPDDSSLFEEDALLRLVSQLRGEADVVLVLAPGWVTDERFHPVLVHADAVIVSLHLDRSLGGRLQELLQYLAGLNVPVAGLMTYAGPDAAERRVDDVFDGRAAAAEESVAVPEATPAPPADPTSSAREPVEGPADVDDTPAFEPDPVEPTTRPRAIEARDEDDGRSSRVFRLAAIASVLALVAFIGWWGLSSRGDGPPLPPGSGAPPVDRAAGGATAETVEPTVDATTPSEVAEATEEATEETMDEAPPGADPAEEPDAPARSSVDTAREVAEAARTAAAGTAEETSADRKSVV